MLDARGRPVGVETWGICDQATALDSLYGNGDGRGYDSRNSFRVINRSGSKPPCNTGWIAADGLLLTCPSSCTCDQQMKGLVAFSSASDFEFNRQADPQTRLERGTAGLEAAAVLPTDAKDWPVDRGNAQGSGATCVSAPARAVRQWQFKPAHPFVNERWPDTQSMEAEHRPTAAICVKDLIFYAGTDGLVHCLDGKSGEQKWSFATDGPVMAAPCFWRGRVYVGSADGYAYALEAATGRLLWRFRAHRRSDEFWSTAASRAVGR